jgi:hypothetical protein
METVTINGKDVRAVSPEGIEARMPLANVLSRIRPRQVDTMGLVLPDGVKALVPGSNGVVAVHQSPPGVRAFKWISGDSPARYGPGTTYREIRLALPYVVVFASFNRSPTGGLVLSNQNECFFANRPVRSLDDELMHAALLNVSLFPSPGNHPLAWLCSQHLNRRPLAREQDENARFTKSLQALLAHLFETGFNFSSDDHEGDSGFSATSRAKLDPRVESVETWQAATEEDPLFVLDVPWLPTGKTVGQIAESIGRRQKGPSASFSSAQDIARILFNRKAKEKS